VTFFGRTRVRSPRWWAIDVALTVAVVGFSAPNWVQAHISPAPAIVLGIAGTVPLVWRRVRPIQVFAVLVVVSAAAGTWNVHLTSGPALLVALYTVAASCSRRQTVIAAWVLEISAVAAAIRVEGVDWWFGSIFLTGMVAAAVGLGLYAATRRAYLRELHDRAERLEREREHDTALAAATERARIAREMHDIVAHHLTVMVALSDGAAAAAKELPRAAEAMRSVSATGRQALADTRRLLGVLGQGDEDTSLAPLPGLGDIETLVATVRAAGLPVNYEISGAAAPLATDAQITVYRIVQEALTNTLKHGGTGTRASVRLRYLPGELHLDIDDDGAGADAPLPQTPGRGLTGMRERVRAFGGQVDSGPRSPSGWRVSAQLRLDESVTS
jgi:signal transduction histidine kinase